FLELLAVSDLVVGPFSTCVSEAVFAGMPYLLMELPVDDAATKPPLAKSLLSPPEPNWWSAQGVIWRFQLPELFDRLPSLTMDQLKIDFPMRRAFIEKLLGFDDGKSSERVLEAIERLAGS
ncbi:MAG: hypothetical protein JRJ59_08490, partial [Deltaproteobacteria bacterium]|nr:hypothetical protein [Deltaproteobacteria bacterium]